MPTLRYRKYNPDGVMAAKAAVQVVAAAQLIPVVTNLEVVAKAVPQSHQRNSLL